MTVADTISTLLSDEWALETTPKFVTMDYGHDSNFEKFDENAVTPQVVVNGETQKEYTHVVGCNYRVVHDINILVFVKPVKYSSDAIDVAKELFNAIITEIDWILSNKRFDITGVVELKLSGWKILTQKKEEPIIFQAVQVTKALYYGVKDCRIWTNQDDCEAHGCTWNVCAGTCGET